MINKDGQIFQNASDNTYPIFIGGEGRSGTTLLRAMLNNHPNIFCGPETHLFIDKDFQRLYNTLREKYNDRILEYESNPEKILNQMYRQFITTFYRGHLEKTGKSRWADKTPHNVKSIDFFYKIFEGNIRFIHMIRDGRDVASSILKMNWGPNTIEDVADRWRKIILDTRKYVGEPYYLELKYEDLINDALHTPLNNH